MVYVIFASTTHFPSKKHLLRTSQSQTAFFGLPVGHENSVKLSDRARFLRVSRSCGIEQFHYFAE